MMKLINFFTVTMTNILFILIFIIIKFRNINSFSVVKIQRAKTDVKKIGLQRFAKTDKYRH